MAGKDRMYYGPWEWSKVSEEEDSETSSMVRREPFAFYRAFEHTQTPTE